MVRFLPVKTVPNDKVPQDKTRRRESRFEARLALLAGAGVTLLVFVLYVLTLAPTILYYDRPVLLDSAMLSTQAIVLGIPGGTGEPTWAMLTHLFTYLPFGDPAYRTNLASAVYAAGTVLLVYRAGLVLSGRVVAAAAGALAFGLGTTFWSQSVIAEVYTLNTLLIMLPVVCLLIWREGRRDRYLLLASFLMGLALTNHLTSGLVLPAAFLFVGLVDRSRLLDWRLALKGAGLFVLGLTPYIYLPLRALMDPPMNEGDPTTFDRFWYLVSGSGHQGNMFAYGPADLPGRFIFYGGYLFENLHWVLVMIAMMGFSYMLFRDRAGAALLGFLYLGWLLYGIEYRIYDALLYFIPTYLMVSLMLAVGVGALAQTAEDLVERLSRPAGTAILVMASVALLLVPLLGAPSAYAENDRSEDYRGRQIIETVAEEALPNSTILHHRSSLWYMVLVEKRRRDLRIIDPWYPSRIRFTDIVWPDDIDNVDTNLRYGTNDYTGVSTVQETAKEGPVYILDQESAGPSNLRDADISIVRVEKGILYELVPPGGKQHTDGPIVG